MMFSITFNFDRETIYRLGKRMGHTGTPVSSMELDKRIRYIVKENFKPNEEDTRPSLRIKKKRH
jgi:hypothetical protein